MGVGYRIEDFTDVLKSEQEKRINNSMYVLIVFRMINTYIFLAK